jgi:antitoxin (DNA-binding transcriptional repressor) of toxin-antitoxin stability system
MDTLTVDDVAEQPARIIHDVEKGEIALVTKEGRPLLVAVPVDARLIKLGLPLEPAFSSWRPARCSAQARYARPFNAESPRNFPRAR